METGERNKDGGLVALAELKDVAEDTLRLELADDGYDLPELADTMDEVNARAAASTFLFALRGVERQMAANDSEFLVLQGFNQARHVTRQSGLIRSLKYLRGVIETLFGFMSTGKKKSLNLIGGRVGMRAQTEELVVEDDAAVIAWAKLNGFEAIVRFTEAVDRKALRTYMVEGAVGTSKATFPSPPGVTLEARPDEFYATPAKD